MKFRHLFYLNRMMLAAEGFAGFFAILRCLLLCRYIAIMDRVITVMNKASPHLLCSLMFGLIVWLMIATGASALFGCDVLQYSSLRASLVSAIYAIARVHHYESLHVSHPLMASMYVMILVLVFICIARTLCAVNMIVSWRQLNQLPVHKHTQLYFAQLANNFRDALSCVAIKEKIDEKKNPNAGVV